MQRQPFLPLSELIPLHAMSSNPPPLLAVLVLLPALLLQASSATPNTDTIQTLHRPPSPPSTIPAFPEQSTAAAAGCPLDLPDDLFHALNSTCGGELHRARCCPVLAAWLYSAYSSNALGRAAAGGLARKGHSSPPYDIPLLPDDSETCVEGLGKALRERGVRLSQPNETCDVVYCYCGIRLHQLTCPEAFSPGPDGKLRGNENVKRLEKDCFSGVSKMGNGFPGLDSCSKCLNSLYQLTKNAADLSKSDDRAARMRDKDCHLMGLTWLLAKNRTAYIHTVSNVLRAIMSSPDGSDPRSCTLGSDGLPLAVGSSEISGSSTSAVTLLSSINVMLLLFALYHCLAIVPSHD